MAMSLNDLHEIGFAHHLLRRTKVVEEVTLTITFFCKKDYMLLHELLDMDGWRGPDEDPDGVECYVTIDDAVILEDALAILEKAKFPRYKLDVQYCLEHEPG